MRLKRRSISGCIAQALLCDFPGTVMARGGQGHRMTSAFVKVCGRRPRCARHHLHGAGIRKPSQQRTSDRPIPRPAAHYFASRPDCKVLGFGIEQAVFSRSTHAATRIHHGAWGRDHVAAWRTCSNTCKNRADRISGPRASFCVVRRGKCTASGLARTRLRRGQKHCFGFPMGNERRRYVPCSRTNSFA